MEIKPLSTPHKVRVYCSDYHKKPRMSDGKIEFELGSRAAFNALFVEGWVTTVVGNKVIAEVRR